MRLMLPTIHRAGLGPSCSEDVYLSLMYKVRVRVEGIQNDGRDTRELCGRPIWSYPRGKSKAVGRDSGQLHGRQ